MAKAKPRADLVVRSVSAVTSGRHITVQPDVKNRGSKRARATSTTILLSADTVSNPSDITVGSVATSGLRPTRSTAPQGAFDLPRTVPAGSYFVLACADGGQRVNEGRKERNNCRSMGLSLTVPPVPTVTISWAADPTTFGTVSATASNGICTTSAPATAGSCTVEAGFGTVVLTAQARPNVPGTIYYFNTWRAQAGQVCDGVRVDRDLKVSTMTFSSPGTNKGCIANFANDA